MQVNSNSSFISYALTAEEKKAGSVFNYNQKAVIQNIIADIAEEKIRLKYDPNNPLEFQQREAELAGQIGILQYLLNLEASIQSE